jgi:hypothetical protein
MALSLAKTSVIPAQAGIQLRHQWPFFLDSGLRRNDESSVFMQ